MRPIKKGEEVCMDYSLSDTLPLWHMKCRCKEKNCRKFIRPFQDLTYRQQRANVKYTAKYIIDMAMHLSWQEYLESQYGKSLRRNGKKNVEKT